MQNIQIIEVGPSCFEFEFQGTKVKAYHNWPTGQAVVRLARTAGLMARQGLVRNFDASQLNGRDKNLALDAYLAAL